MSTVGTESCDGDMGKSLKETANIHRLRWLGFVLSMRPKRMIHRALFSIHGLGWTREEVTNG